MSTKKTETLEERAARAQAELQAVYQEQERLALIEAEKLAAHQEAVDVEAVSAYDRAALEAEVTHTKQALDKAIEEAPLTQALTAHFIAVARRREVFDQYLGARSRQGHAVGNAQYPPPPAIDNLADLMIRAAEGLASDWRQEFATDFANRRATLPTKGK